MTETFPHLALEREAGVATLWLDRPDKLNALDRELWRSLPDAVAHLDQYGLLHRASVNDQLLVACAGCTAAPGIARPSRASSASCFSR